MKWIHLSQFCLILGIIVSASIPMINSVSAYHFTPGVDVDLRLVFHSYVKPNATSPVIDTYEGYIITSISDANATISGESMDSTEIHAAVYEISATEYASNPDLLFTSGSLLLEDKIVGSLFTFHYPLRPMFIPADRKVSDLEQRYNLMGWGGANYTVAYVDDGRGVIISLLPLEYNCSLKFVYTCNGVLESMDTYGLGGRHDTLTLVSGDKGCPDYSFLIIIAIVAGIGVGICTLNVFIKKRRGNIKN